MRLFVLTNFVALALCQAIIYHSPALIDDVIVSGDTVVIGAVNSLNTLSKKDLQQLYNVTTGPVRDSQLCSADGKSCLRDVKPTLTDVRTKVLIRLPDGILHCASVRQGSCSFYSPKLLLKSTSTVPVAANDPEASTVALLVEDKLMVAASSTTESPYRDPFPSVAVRDLTELSVVNAGDLDGEAAVFLRAAYRNAFRYVYAFKHEHFIFVVAVQTQRQNRLSSATKLIRFCTNDTRFVSYSEIELQCRGEDNSIFPIMTSVAHNGDRLIATFAQSSTSKKSFLCAYSMQRIKLTYWYNVDRCRGGTDSIKLPHIGRDSKCLNKAHLPLAEDTCELGVGGSIEAVEMAIEEFAENITALLPVDRKVLLVGTDSGQIIMMKWHENELAEYGRKDVGDDVTGAEIRKMIRVDDHVLVQLPRGIVKEEIATCAHHKTCGSCLVSADPLCHWCHSTLTCTTSARCSVPLSPICPETDGAPKPDQISVNQTALITVPIRHLPPPNGFYYRCWFGSEARTTANWTENGVVCPANVFSTEKFYTLAVTTSLSTSPIVAHNFSVYDCSTLKTCSQCSSSKWSCEWCPAVQSCLRQDSCSGPKAKACVRLLPMKVPVAIGSEQEIVIEAENLNSLKWDQEHFCRVNVSGKMHSSRAKITPDAIRCGKLTLTSRNRKLIANQSVPLMLTTNEQIVDVANLSLYSCSSLASDCSSCLSLLPSLSCGWCQGRCSHDCHHLKYTACDPPKILHFEPTSGPVEGGTILSIYGKDLGTSIEDVRGRVLVAGSRCEVIDYKISNLIVCRLEKGTASGPIRVSVGRTSIKTAESTSYFSFVQVSVFSAYPLFGPISGGTKISLYGQNLNCGTNTSVTVGDSPCGFVGESNSTSSLICTTPAGLKIGKSARVVVRTDKSTVTLETPFEYRPDPVVTGIYPHSTFRSGGRTVSIQGISLDSVVSPRMYFVSSTIPPYHVVSELSSCQVVNATLMTCQTPKILEKAANRLEYSRFPVGFAMDNVTSVQNLGRRMEMNVAPDPQLAPFKGIRLHQGEQPLILEGNHLNRAAEPHDFKVYIGSERCYVTLVDVKQLVCSGPVRQPAATDENGKAVLGSLPLVTVIVGNVRTELGLIEFVDHNLSLRLWIMVATTSFVLMIVLCTLCVIWKRRRAERERDYRKIQMQMESLESTVRKECKQAFAELQTTLAPSPTSDDAPLLPFSMFVENILWADGMTNSTPTLGHTLPVTLAQFHTLLTCKNFIFALVEVAESDMSMSPGERSMLSSLLISVLLRNFSYCTDVVIDLLRAHIARTVHAKNADMLFRQSDSVVEKMVAKWMSICMHAHIGGQIQSFYSLYKALKYQTEKGPVDAVTGAARYTINESKLLRESVDAATITIRVSPLEGGEMASVDIHACDAVCQIKQKAIDVIYRHVPHSQRPSITQFDLQLQCPRNGALALNDVGDSDTQRNGPSKLRTAADYGLANGAYLQMTPASCRMECYRNSLADSGQSSWSSLDRFSPVYSPSQYYHLTNPLRTLTIDKRKKIDDSIPKSIPEVYLTRLLTSKGTVQTYVEDFLESVLYMEDASFPPILKYFFDLLDREAATNGVSESMCQQWKSNGYVLRIWANFLKNPRLLFDISDSACMDANLSTVAQTMMDCFSFSEPNLGAHSPSSRLLFAKDVARLRPLSSDLFRRIKRSPPLSFDNFRMEIANVANDVSTCKGSSVALSELLSWVRGNGIRVTEILSTDSEALAQRLPQRLSQVLNVCLEPEHIYSTISDYQ